LWQRSATYFGPVSFGIGNLAIESSAMPFPLRHWSLAAVVTTTCLLSGCLSLGLGVGGRTTVVHEKPETTSRLAALEARVNTLEHATFRGPEAESIETQATASVP
jgi:outer membrane murein-binding lipoprotein Lpp